MSQSADPAVELLRARWVNETGKGGSKIWSDVEHCVRYGGVNSKAKASEEKKSEAKDNEDKSQDVSAEERHAKSQAGSPESDGKKAAEYERRASMRTLIDEIPQGFDANVFLCYRKVEPVTGSSSSRDALEYYRYYLVIVDERADGNPALLIQWAFEENLKKKKSKSFVQVRRVDARDAAQVDSEIVVESRVGMNQVMRDRLLEVCGMRGFSFFLRNDEHVARYVWSGRWASDQVCNTLLPLAEKQGIARSALPDDVALQVPPRGLVADNEDALEINVVFYGKVSCGKSQLLRALLSEATGKVIPSAHFKISPQGGSTVAAKSYYYEQMTLFSESALPETHDGDQSIACDSPSEEETVRCASQPAVEIEEIEGNEKNEQLQEMEPASALPQQMKRDQHAGIGGEGGGEEDEEEDQDEALVAEEGGAEASSVPASQTQVAVLLQDKASKALEEGSQALKESAGQVFGEGVQAIKESSQVLQESVSSLITEKLHGGRAPEGAKSPIRKRRRARVVFWDTPGIGLKMNTGELSFEEIKKGIDAGVDKVDLCVFVFNGDGKEELYGPYVEMVQQIITKNRYKEGTPQYRRVPRRVILVRTHGDAFEWDQSCPLQDQFDQGLASGESRTPGWPTDLTSLLSSVAERMNARLTKEGFQGIYPINPSDVAHVSTRAFMPDYEGSPFFEQMLEHRTYGLQYLLDKVFATATAEINIIQLDKKRRQIDQVSSGIKRELAFGGGTGSILGLGVGGLAIGAYSVFESVMAMYGVNAALGMMGTTAVVGVPVLGFTAIGGLAAAIYKRNDIQEYMNLTSEETNLQQGVKTAGYENEAELERLGEDTAKDIDVNKPISVAPVLEQSEMAQSIQKAVEDHNP